MFSLADVLAAQQLLRAERQAIGAADGLAMLASGQAGMVVEGQAREVGQAEGQQSDTEDSFTLD